MLVAETMLAPPVSDNWTWAEALEQVRERIEEAFNDARQILAGTGVIEERAQVWLAYLDEATGVERTVTIDDSIRELRR